MTGSAADLIMMEASPLTASLMMMHCRRCRNRSSVGCTSSNLRRKVVKFCREACKQIRCSFTRMHFYEHTGIPFGPPRQGAKRRPRMAIGITPSRAVTLGMQRDPTGLWKRVCSACSGNQQPRQFCSKATTMCTATMLRGQGAAAYCCTKTQKLKVMLSQIKNAFGGSISCRVYFQNTFYYMRYAPWPCDYHNHSTTVITALTINGCCGLRVFWH